MARQQAKNMTGRISTTFGKVIADYPLLVIHTAFILGVMLGRQAARSRFSLGDWAKGTLPATRRAMTAPLASFTRRSDAAPARRKRARRQASGRAGGRASAARRQAQTATAAE